MQQYKLQELVIQKEKTVVDMIAVASFYGALLQDVEQ